MPTILMFVRILLSISSSSASTRVSSKTGALPSRASTSSSMLFIVAPPGEPARSSHPARWPCIRRTLFKSCPTNVRRVDKGPRSKERRRAGLPHARDGRARSGDHHDPVRDLSGLERAAERAHLGERLRLAIVEDRDVRLRDARLAQEELGEGDVDDDLTGVEPRAPRDAV